MTIWMMRANAMWRGAVRVTVALWLFFAATSLALLPAPVLGADEDLYVRVLSAPNPSTLGDTMSLIVQTSRAGLDVEIFVSGMMSTSTTDANGLAYFEFTDLPLGEHEVFAYLYYRGTLVSSTLLIHTVEYAPAVADVLLSSPYNPSSSGKMTRFDVSVANNYTGMATLVVDSSVVGYFPVTDGFGSYEVQLSEGEHWVSAEFATADGNVSGQSQTMAQQVEAPVTASALTEPDPEEPGVQIVTVDTNKALRLIGIKVGNGAQQAFTDEKGTATIRLELEPGTYPVDIELYDENGSVTDTYSTTVEVSAVTTPDPEPVLTLSSSSNPSVAGTPVTLSVSVSDDTTGTVEIERDGAPFATVAVLDGSGTIDVDLEEGSHELRARLVSGGQTIYSDILIQVVESAVVIEPVVSLSSSANPSLPGAPVTLTVSVDDGSSGTAEIERDGTSFASIDVVDGVGKIVIEDLEPGETQFVASYTSTAVTAHLSQPLVQRVEAVIEPPSPEITLISSANPSAEGDAVRFTVTVSGEVGGDVELVVDGARRASAAIRNGTAALVVADLAAGEHDIVARFTSADGTIAIASASVRQVVTAEDRTAVVVQTFERLGQDFVQSRSLILGEQFDMPGFGTGPDGFSMSGSDSGPVLNFAASSDVFTPAGDAAHALAQGQVDTPYRFWIDGKFGLHFDDATTGRFGVVSLGADYRFGDDLIVGLAGFADYFGSDGPDGEVEGWGGVAGPYVSVRLSDSYSIDASLLYGGSSNDVSSTIGGDLFTGSFDTTRWIGQSQFNARWMLDEITLRANTGVYVSSETSDGYVVSDGNGTFVDMDGFSTGSFRLSAGTSVERSFALSNGAVLKPHVGFTAAVGGAGSQPDLDTLSGKLTLGAQLNKDAWSLRTSVDASAVTSGAHWGAARVSLSAAF